MEKIEFMLKGNSRKETLCAVISIADFTEAFACIVRNRLKYSVQDSKVVIEVIEKRCDYGKTGSPD